MTAIVTATVTATQADAGECETNPGFMHQACAGSCRTCDERKLEL